MRPPHDFSQIGNIQDDIKRYNDNVATISDLQARSLNNLDDNAAQRIQQQLQQLSEEQSQLSGSLKRRIKDLERQGGSGRDAQVKKQQTAFVKSKFVEAIQNYQQIEQQSRTKYKQRMERQFKIGKLKPVCALACSLASSKTRRVAGRSARCGERRGRRPDLLASSTSRPPRRRVR